MPNYTSVPGGTAGATTPSSYYTNANAFGEYQFISLTEIVDNFIATYVGEGKILGTTLKGDVNYHAHRALQELSYDTLKSCKSQEIEVCPNLRMPLPHDYVNYVKLTWSDSNGIEHIIYPAHKTSNPFAISQDDNCEYQYATDSEGNPSQQLLQQENCVDTTYTCNEVDYSAWGAFVGTVGNITSFPHVATIGGIQYTFNSVPDIEAKFFSLIDTYCNCLSNYTGTNCGEYYETAQGVWTWDNLNNIDWSTITYTTSICDNDSDTLNNWESLSSSTNLSLSNTTATDDDIYNNALGQRRGIDPQYAQSNGSFYIECRTGMIYFGSSLAGKTVTLKYISDGHGTDNEMIVHKFAEEAMYKWIAYGCASARIDVPENVR